MMAGFNSLPLINTWAAEPIDFAIGKLVDAMEDISTSLDVTLS
jgi:hypothetical protein